MKNFDPTLYFITDSTGFSEEEFLRRIEEALKGGVSLLQLREKDKTTREYIALAQKVHTLTKKYNVPLIIDDRMDVALAMGAEGVHLGQSDMPIATARMVSTDWIFSQGAQPGRKASLFLVQDHTTEPLAVSMTTPHTLVVPMSIPR